MKEIYEIHNTTSDEVYYPMGIYFSLEDAEKAIESRLNEDDYLTDNGDSWEGEKISIVESKTGWGGSQKTVREYVRVSKYDKTTDTDKWMTKKYKILNRGKREEMLFD